MFYRLDSGAAGGAQTLGPGANMSLGDMQQQVSMLELLGLLRAVRVVSALLCFVEAFPYTLRPLSAKLGCRMFWGVKVRKVSQWHGPWHRL